MNRRRIWAVPLLLIALLAAACGQKEGVAGSDVATDDTGGTTGGTTGGDGGGSTTIAAPPAGHEPDDNDTAGVTDEEIVIGIHAPVTGASPIPQETFEVGKDIYWSFLAASDPELLFGRTVRVVFRDDTFNPERAVSVCREMVEEEGAFLLVGGGGADQITACAQYANEANVPYLSAGVNTTGLSDLSSYYATTMTYAEQAPLVMAQVEAAGLTEVALAVLDTPSFADAHDALVDAAAEAGITITADISLSKDAGEPELLAAVQEIGDVEGLVLLSSPVIYIQLANAAQNQGLALQYFGPGITSGLNAVTAFGCPAVGTGKFLSPVPGLDVADDLDPDYSTAYTEFAGGAEPDDIGFQLWSLNKALGLMFAATGQELGRAAFMNTLETTEAFDNGIYPLITFTPEDHFGGTGAHLLQADCDAQQYTTAEQFIEAG